MVICLEQGADLHIAQLMPLPLTVSCFSKIQIGFTFLVPAHLGSPGKEPLDRLEGLVSNHTSTSLGFHDIDDPSFFLSNCAKTRKSSFVKE